MNRNESEAVIRDTIEYANKEIEKAKKKSRRWIIVLALVCALFVSFSAITFAANTQERTIITLREHSQNADGIWECEGNTYKYKMEITGRMPNADCDSTFIYLSNSEKITLEQAWKAAGFSSNLNDYFDVEDAVLVGMSSK